jgi:hypothetical protein
MCRGRRCRSNAKGKLQKLQKTVAKVFGDGAEPLVPVWALI